MRKPYLILMLLALLFTQSCAAYRVEQKENANAISEYIQKIEKSGVKEYLTYYVIDNSQTNCSCADGVSKAYLFYIQQGHTLSVKFDCCMPDKPVAISDSFFIKLSGYSSRITPEKKQKFYPPIATDQQSYRIKYQSNKGNGFDFTISQNQVTEGTDEQKAWDKIPGFREKQAIFNYVTSAGKK